MKTLIKIFSLIFLSSVVFYSCNDADLDVVDNSAGYSEGGLIRNDSKLVNYVIGSDQAYNFDMLIYQGAIKTTSVNIMKSFTTSTGLSSNTILLKNVAVTNPDSDFFSFATTYTELIAGLEIGGEPLPASDSDLAIADYWTLTYVAVTSEGNEHINGTTSKLAVSTRLAGFYTVIDSEYLHPVGSQGPFPRHENPAHGRRHHLWQGGAPKNPGRVQHGPVPDFTGNADGFKGSPFSRR